MGNLVFNGKEGMIEEIIGGMIVERVGSKLVEKNGSVEFKGEAAG